MAGRGITLPAGSFSPSIFDADPGADSDQTLEIFLEMLAESFENLEKRGEMGFKRPKMRNSGKSGF